MRRWRLWLGLAISLICLVLAALGIDWHQVAAAFGQANLLYFLPALVACIAFLAARSQRWRVLLGPEVAFGDAFSVTNIGYLISNVLPFRLGDPARAVAVGMKGTVRTSAALSTVIVERVLDMAMVVVLLALVVPWVGQAGWLRAAGIVGGAAAAVALAALAAMAAYPGWSKRAVGWLAARIPRANPQHWEEMAGGLLDGLTALHSWRRVGALVLWTVVTWACSVALYYSVLRAFVRPTLVQAAFLTCSVGLSMALPSSPGAVGVFHSVARYALELPFGVAGETALAVAFAAHAFQYVVMCALGFAGLLQQNLSLARLRAGIASSLAEE